MENSIIKLIINLNENQNAKMSLKQGKTSPVTIRKRVRHGVIKFEDDQVIAA